ncbi:signal peptidase I [Paenibacillus sp. UNC451MF]|uniref:signal peptidase I n=1 Tax=Paenibacillus sp. UNC451MF TaxID=1449063 RepID=UPI00049148D4|nr:signal peptidase I [Paenibacillus sp. UNC451MF]
MELILVLLLSISVVYGEHHKPYVTTGPSMEPNYYQDQRITVDLVYYNDHSFYRGDVIVFQATKDKTYIKRVIALPGETVRIDGDNVYINGQLLYEPYLQSALEEEAARTKVPYNYRNMKEITVPEHTVFVLGDNRSNSLDSRDLGPVSFDTILGKVND